MISYSALRIVVSADTFVSVSSTNLILSVLVVFIITLLFIIVIQLALQNVHSFFFVFKLTSFILTCNNQVERQVCNTDCSFNLVYILSTCSTRMENINTQIFIQNFDVNVLYFWQNRNSRCGSVNTSLTFCLWHSLNSMHPTLIFHTRISTLALNHDCCFFDSANFCL